MFSAFFCLPDFFLTLPELFFCLPEFFKLMPDNFLTLPDFFTKMPDCFLKLPESISDRRDVACGRLYNVQKNSCICGKQKKSNWRGRSKRPRCYCERPCNAPYRQRMRASLHFDKNHEPLIVKK